MLSKLEEKLKYSFASKELLHEALTHPSKKLDGKNIKSYQRLEFLGDKVLNFVIANALFKQFPNEDEGQISRRHSHLVCGSICFEVAKKIEIMPHVIFSNAQKKDESYNISKVGEDTIEAIIGAIFLDSNIQSAEKFVLENWSDFFLKDLTPPKDAKSTVQEYFQKKFKFLPEYAISTEGAFFIATISLNGKKISGKGQTKKDAEKACAQNVLNNLQNSAN